MKNRTTPDNITELKDNEVFCFGSNTAGIHGAGSAKVALRWGAKYRVGVGLQGQTYAIPTKDAKIHTMAISEIEPYVSQFIIFAKQHPELTFLVVAIGCQLAGYQPNDIAPLFADAIDVPNIHLPARFWRILQK